MKVKELIEALNKVKNKEAFVGWGVWFGDKGLAQGHTIYWDAQGTWMRNPLIEFTKGKGKNATKVVVVGWTDNCPAHSFGEFSKGAKSLRLKETNQ